MKKTLTFILLITLPTFVFSQSTVNKTDREDEITITDRTTVNEQIVNHISLITPATINVTDISYKKSYDLVSIKAYRKSLQIRIKDIKTC